MSEKTFLTIDELINNIKSKNINIKYENNVRNILETNNYYFIMGYKFAFKNNNGTRVITNSKFYSLSFS